MLSGEIWTPQPRGGPASCIPTTGGGHDCRLQIVWRWQTLLVSYVAMAGGSVPVLVTDGHCCWSLGSRQHFSERESAQSLLQSVASQAATCATLQSGANNCRTHRIANSKHTFLNETIRFYVNKVLQPLKYYRTPIIICLKDEPETIMWPEVILVLTL